MGMPRRALLLFVVAIGQLLAARADAAGPEAQLEYTREQATESCADEADVRSAVAVRLGRDPFTKDAPRTVVVALRRDGMQLKAVLQMRDAAGTISGRSPRRARTPFHSGVATSGSSPTSPGPILRSRAFTHRTAR